MCLTTKPHKHSLIIVYVHPKDLPAVLPLAGHEVVVGRIVGRRWSRLKTTGPPVVGGVSDRVGGRLVVNGAVAGRPSSTAASRQAVGAVVMVLLALIAVASRAPAFRVVVIEGVVGGRAVGHVVLPLVGVGQQLLLFITKFRFRIVGSLFITNIVHKSMRFYNRLFKEFEILSRRFRLSTRV